MKFLIIGGDKRNFKLAELLKKDGHEVKTYGLEKIELQTCECTQKIENIMQHFDAIIGPIPFTNNEETLNAPYSEKNILLKELLPILKEQTLIAGPISETLKQNMLEQKIKVINLMKIEELVIYNTIATAEGAIKVAIENSEINLHESKILILGFGRVAKTLANRLKGLSQNITCAARKQSDFALIETLGFKTQNINELKQLNEYDIIINTVPQVVLNQVCIENINNDALYIELASKPGGIEQELIKTLDFKYISAQGLPGKVAPLASAKYIKQIIYKLMKE